MRKFLSKSNSVRLTLLAVMSGTMLVMFQNCTNRMSFRPIDEVESVVQSSINTDNLSNAAINSNLAEKVYVGLVANAEAQSDCSQDNSTLTSEIRNVGVDILYCLQSTIDIPAGNARTGEVKSCAAASNYSTVPATWKYDSVQRKFVIPEEKLKNHATLIPGTYKLFVKDNQGVVYQSANAIIKKSNAASCAVVVAAPVYTPPVYTAPPMGYLARPSEVPNTKYTVIYFLSGSAHHNPYPVNTECNIGVPSSGFYQCADPSTWAYDPAYGEAVIQCTAWTQQCTANPN